MRACCAILILVPLALGASVPKNQRPETSRTAGQPDRSIVQPSAFHLPPASAPAANLLPPAAGLAELAPPPAASLAPPPSTRHLPQSAESWIPPPFSHYEGIISRMPFGQPPPPASAAAIAAAIAPPPPAFSNKLTLCAINRAPNGSLAVGFVDTGVTPPHNYYLDVGDSEESFTVLSADIEQESAVIDKDGVSVTLKLPGSDRRVTSAMDLAALTAAKFASLAQPPDDATNAPPQKPAFTNTTEQILGMIASAPAGTAPPPLPISASDDSAENTANALASVIVINADDDEATVKHKETVAWIKEDMRQTLATNGGTSSSYIQRLYARQQEIEKTRKEEAEKLRKLAESATREKIKAELDATNARLNTQEIPGIGQDEVIDPEEEDQ